MSSSLILIFFNTSRNTKISRPKFWEMTQVKERAEAMMTVVKMKQVSSASY